MTKRLLLPYTKTREVISDTQSEIVTNTKYSLKLPSSKTQNRAIIGISSLSFIITTAFIGER